MASRLMAVNNRPQDLTPELVDVYRVTSVVLGASGEEEALRQRIREWYGEEGLVELALGLRRHACSR